MSDTLHDSPAERARRIVALHEGHLRQRGKATVRAANVAANRRLNEARDAERDVGLMRGLNAEGLPYELKRARADRLRREALALDAVAARALADLRALRVHLRETRDERIADQHAALVESIALVARAG